MTSTDLLPAVVVTAAVVLLLVLGAIRVASGYRKVRARIRRLSQTRLVFARVTPRRKGARRRG